MLSVTKAQLAGQAGPRCAKIGSSVTCMKNIIMSDHACLNLTVHNHTARSPLKRFVVMGCL